MKAKTAQGNHSNTQALKLQHPPHQVPSIKRGSVDYAVVPVMLSTDLGLFPSFNSQLLPCRSCRACAVSTVPVCRADALRSSDTEAAVRNGCASSSSWKQLLTEFGIRAEPGMHLGGLNCS